MMFMSPFHNLIEQVTFGSIEQELTMLVLVDATKKWGDG